ncbi:MAG: M16 family metallopeptidase [Gemmatimonadales bacterium]
MSWTEGVIREVLPNGLTVVVQQDTSAPVVAVVTHVKAGYFDEPDEWVGIAHVLEHMFFKGTARRKPGEVARDTQLLGGYLNAATIYDKTVYYTVLPAAGGGLERALDIQSDALINAALDGGELRRELEVIVQEARRKLDAPAAVVGETLYSLLFSRHRMRRWRVGSEEGLRKLTADDLCSYYTTRYTPGRIIVGIVGDLNADTALRLAEEAYGGWNRPEASVEGSPKEPDRTPASVCVLSGDVARPLVVVGWRTVDALHETTPALDVAAVVLGAGRGSRLYRGVRSAGLANAVGSSHYTPTELGVFGISLESEPRTLDEAVERSLGIVEQLIEEEVDAVELERARSLVAASWARRFESVDGRAAVLCEAEALGGYELAQNLFDQTMRVTPADVKNAFTKYLRPADASAAFYLPDGATTDWDDGRWPVRSANCDLAAPQSVRLPRHESSAATVSREVTDLGGIAHVAFEGIDLLVFPKRGAGLVSIALQVPGIPEMETETTAGVSSLLARVALKGAGGLERDRLFYAAELLGGGIGPSVSVDGLGWSATVRAESARQAARLLRTIALEPSLCSEDIEVERALQAGDARRLRDDMYGYPLQCVLSQAYGPDPYGLPALGDAEIVSAITDQDIRTWHEQVKGHRAVAAAVGDLGIEDLLGSLGPLSDWPAGSGSGQSGLPAPQFESDCGLEDRVKEQTALAMAFPAASGGSTDRHAISVMCALLSGLAGRLFAELREKRSLAYTVAAMPWLRRRAGVVMTYIAMSPEREDEARAAMLAELSHLSAESVREDELDRARNYAAGLVEIQRQRSESVAGEILRAWLNGSASDFSQRAHQLRSVTAEDVRRVSYEVFGAGRRAEYVVRGK